MLDGFLVPFPGFGFGLLTGPAQAAQKLPDMAGVIADPEVPLGHLRNPAQGPEVRGVSGGQGIARENPQEPSLLSRR